MDVSVIISARKHNGVKGNEVTTFSSSNIEQHLRDYLAYEGDCDHFTTEDLTFLKPTIKRPPVPADQVVSVPILSDAAVIPEGESTILSNEGADHDSSSITFRSAVTAEAPMEHIAMSADNSPRSVPSNSAAIEPAQILRPIPYRLPGREMHRLGSRKHLSSISNHSFGYTPIN